jgi:guanylate kinase
LRLNKRKIIIITAPSGSGKTTLVKELLKNCPELSFSVSACTRPARAGEIHGKDYYFFDVVRFNELIEQDAFAEWEMVYDGKYYGTLKTELERIWQEAHTPLVDIDVKGALAIKQTYPENSLSIFIQAPSVEVLKARLKNRGTETEKSLEERIAKANVELTFAHQFDQVLINDDLATATQSLLHIVIKYLQA